MSDRDHRPEDHRPEDHRPEPEIIPPGAPDPAGRWQDRREPRRQQEQNRIWIWSNDPRYAHLRQGRSGPLGLVIILAALAGLGALGFVVLLGAVALALPIIAAVVLAGILGSILRRL